jgi:predicted nucleotide-binding protein
VTTNEDERNRLIKELEDFRKDFIKYKELVLSKQKGDTLTVSQELEFQTLWTELPCNYGRLKKDIEKYGGVASVPLQGGRREYEAFTSSFSYTPFHIISLTALLDKAITTIGIAIGNLNLLPSATAKTQDVTITNHPKAFIAHGGKSVALDKLCRFVEALGVKALVVEEQPSKAKALDDKVEYYMSEADCAIILAMGNDEIKGKLYPRQNVIHEIGLAQRTLPERIIYLLEKGTEFPSNIHPKVWESFTQDCMDEAFIAIARELRAFGLINATKECK